METKEAEKNVKKVEKKPLEKVCIICAKGSLEDVYAALVMSNGAVMEGIETNVFFTFFGLDAITKDRMNHLHTATTGNPAMRMPGGLPFPTMLGGLPGVETAVSSMMRKQMEELDIPPVEEFLEMITAGGGRIFACKLAVDMFKLKKEDLWNEVEDIITVGQFYELCDGDRTQIIFT
ncbi:MAG: DsrE/DsrF/DrsH-like family protein [Flavobacteriaceae bacterium]|nr:DsrE/DsrF/DrsH-like family protein [Flavobacteriaceae bacterium]MCB0474726.1 DsrE/DsrF/DrsH-like family protein [Flavobacteriaceae bacterium]